MKKIMMYSIFIFIFILLISNVYATQKLETKGNDKSAMIQSGDMIKETEIENLRNEEKAHQSLLAEEGANVDTSITQKNYQVEAPTIVLLSFFGILTLISMILIIFKI